MLSFDRIRHTREQRCRPRSRAPFYIRDQDRLLGTGTLRADADASGLLREGRRSLPRGLWPFVVRTAAAAQRKGVAAHSGRRDRYGADGGQGTDRLCTQLD